jgi:hypothetical protein
MAPSGRNATVRPAAATRSSGQFFGRRSSRSGNGARGVVIASVLGGAGAEGKAEIAGPESAVSPVSRRGTPPAEAPGGAPMPKNRANAAYGSAQCRERVASAAAVFTMWSKDDGGR